jgi:hypothetical protein
MSVFGTIQNGGVVLDSPILLAEGTRVEVELREVPAAATPLGEMLLKHAGVVSGPSDWAQQHDHYIHGTPKR